MKIKKKKKLLTKSNSPRLRGVYDIDYLIIVHIYNNI